MEVWIPDEEGLALLGPIPEGLTIEIRPKPQKAEPADLARVEFWVPPYTFGHLIPELAGRMPALRYMQLMTAGADAYLDHVPAGVALCDARGVHDLGTSEWVLTAILAHLRRIPDFVRAQARREWAFHAHTPTPELSGKRVLMVGAGAIGEAIRARLEPFGVRLTRVARRARPAEGVHATEELPGLLPDADIVVLVVPLTAQTRSLVDAEFLARMRDGALLVNAARGPVVETAALTAELATGRIGAVLDVFDPEPLPADHPLWGMPNVLITPHIGGAIEGLYPRAYGLIGDQLRRIAAGEEPVNQVTDGY